MRSDSLQIALRRRSMMEAQDLGVRLIWQERRALLSVYGPLALAVGLLALGSMAISENWGPLLVWLLARPWLDRALLQCLSRRLFGQACSLADVLKPAVLFSPRLWPGLLVAALSPWRALTLPVQQLEGLRGAAARQRRKQLLRGHHAVAAICQLTWDLLSLWLVMAFAASLYSMHPATHASGLTTWMLSDEGSGAWLMAGLGIVVPLFIEPLFLAGGFMMYLNRRVALEAWDVEQELRSAFAR